MYSGISEVIILLATLRIHVLFAVMAASDTTLTYRHNEKHYVLILFASLCCRQIKFAETFFLQIPAPAAYSLDSIASTLYYFFCNIVFSMELNFTSRPNCMLGSRDPGVTIVNPTKISIMYGYVT